MASNFIPVETILKVEEEELGSSNLIEAEKSLSVKAQCAHQTSDWETKPPPPKESILSSDVNSDSSEKKISVNNHKSSEIPYIESNGAVMNRPWVIQNDRDSCENQKFVFSPGFSQEFGCNFPSFPMDDKFFLQFDYKTRNKLKTKQRRLDPLYRNQERIRQRTVMRLKRQDPRFRAVEREKGRYRMRLKRLDPIFRSQERERQRERMKQKRRDPDFREKEREQQKSRLHVKKLNTQITDNEGISDQLQICIKQHNDGSFSSNANLDKNNLCFKDTVETAVAVSQNCLKNVSSCEHSDIKGKSEANSNLSVISKFNDLKPLTLNIGAHSCPLEQFSQKSHVLSFHFYNTVKETWPSQTDLCSQNGAYYNVSKENLHFHHSYNINKTESTNMSTKEKSEISKEISLHDGVDGKLEAPVATVTHQGKQHSNNGKQTAAISASLIVSTGECH